MRNACSGFKQDGCDSAQPRVVVWVMVDAGLVDIYFVTEESKPRIMNQINVIMNQ